jgi:NAD(P)-dependent dehydrogenase (short-subunit alcohol dehydrogenase family)
MLEATVAELRERGTEAIGVRTDVTSYESVEALADAAWDAYGAVNILCNNAGVGPPGGLVWESTPNDWKWTFGVNVFGVAHGIQAFVPRMLESGEEGLVINTSSPDGPIAPMPQASVYAATKCAVTCLTECLGAQLDAQGATVRAAVFYPSGRGLLDTGLWTSDRNRPTCRGGKLTTPRTCRPTSSSGRYRSVIRALDAFVPSSGPKSIHSLYAGVRASGNVSHRTTVPARTSSRWRSSIVATIRTARWRAGPDTRG